MEAATRRLSLRLIRSDHPRDCGDVATVEVNLASEEWRSLTPSSLGPFHVTDCKHYSHYYLEGIQPGFQAIGDKQVALCRNVTNCFEYSLIYDRDVRHGLVTRDFFERRARGFSSPIPRHSSLRKRQSAVAFYFDGQVHSLSLVNYYYCHYYSHVLQHQDAFHRLEAMSRSAAITIRLDHVAACDVALQFDSDSGDYLQRRYREGGMGPDNYGLIIACSLLHYSPWRLDSSDDIVREQ